MLGYDTLAAGAAARRAARRACASETPAQRRRAAPRAWPRSATSETINFSFVDERWEHELRRQRRPDPRAEPDRQPLTGDALEPDRQPGRRAARQPRAQGERACGCSSSARVFVRDARAADGRARRRRRAPADAPRRPRVRPGRAAAVGRARSARSISSTSRAMSRRCFAPARRELRRRRASGAASGAQRAVELDGARDRHRRRAASALAPGVRAAGSAGRSSSSTPTRCMRRTLPVFAPLPQQQSAWRDIAVVAGRRRHATTR